MTDRYNAYVVVLEKDRRDDDAEHLTNLLRAIRGVESVEPHVSSIEDHVAQSRARSEVRKLIFELLEKLNP